jgi:hypothetical protein
VTLGLFRERAGIRDLRRVQTEESQADDKPATFSQKSAAGSDATRQFVPAAKRVSAPAKGGAAWKTRMII